MTWKDLLIKARASISNSKHWAANLGEVDDTRMCALVALRRLPSDYETTKEATKRLKEVAIKLLGNRYNPMSINHPAAQYNDISKHKDVLKMFDLAIGDA